jgi:hypothetical protein
MPYAQYEVKSMLCESFYYRKKRDSHWSESLAVAAAVERLQSSSGIGDTSVDAPIAGAGAVPTPTGPGGTGLEPTPASQTGSVFSFPDAPIPPGQRDPTPDPTASMVKSGRNLLQPCVAVAQDPTGYCSKYVILA